MAQDTHIRRGPEPPDLAERGGMKNGQPQRSDERLFMQLLVYGGCRDSGAVSDALSEAGVTGVVYEDANDPQGVAILSVTPDPNFFIDTLRPLLNGASCELEKQESMRSSRIWPEKACATFARTKRSSLFRAQRICASSRLGRPGTRIC